MSEERNKKKEVRSQRRKPINVTCGGCKKVFPYEGSYECPNCGYGK